MDVHIVAPGDGEVITDRPGRSLRILAAHELLTLCAFRIAPGETGPDLHVHLEHADGFYVLEGELTLTLGREQQCVSAGPGTLVVAPAGVPHTFANRGEDEVAFLNIHAPDAGFAAYLRSERDAFDQFDPPPDGGRPAAAAIVRGPGEGEVLGPLEIKLSARDGDGTLTVNETTAAPGFPGPVPHRHRGMADAFYVLEGTLTLATGSRTAALAAGGAAFAPPGAVHTFSNPGGAPVRLINLMAPSGFEEYLRRMMAGEAGTPPDPQRMAAIAAEYDFEPA